MTHRFGILRRFRFNLPQRVAAGLLLLFLAQGVWIVLHQAPPDGDALMRLFLLLPLAAGCLLGGALWWVTRRLYGNRGGYTALALYCFSPAVLQAGTGFSPEVLTTLGIYGGVYTCIGVAHAMQGPRRKWLPRVLLLTAAFASVAMAHLDALPLVALLGLGLMLWVAEGRRRLVLPVVVIAVAGALGVVCATGGWWRLNLIGQYRTGLVFFWLSLRPALRFFASAANLGITTAATAALLLYLLQRRTRYFGNTAPLICTLVLMVMVLNGTQASTRLWALPFLLTFIGGVFADAYDGPRGRLALGAAGAMVLAQAVFGWLSLARLR